MKRTMERRHAQQRLRVVHAVQMARLGVESVRERGDVAAAHHTEQGIELENNKHMHGAGRRRRPLSDGGEPHSCLRAMPDGRLRPSV